MKKRYKTDQSLYKEIISAYAYRESISHTEAARRIDLLCDILIEFIKNYGLFQLRRIGTVKSTLQKNVKYHNRHTGENQIVPLRVRMTFTPSTTLRNELNREVRKDLVKSIIDKKRNCIE